MKNRAHLFFHALVPASVLALPHLENAVRKIALNPGDRPVVIGATDLRKARTHSLRCGMPSQTC